MTIEDATLRFQSGLDSRIRAVATNVVGDTGAAQVSNEANLREAAE
nr:hypothetical protein 1 [Rhodospirillaceae bacterium]